ncbi:MAG TPA: hypothetical protein VNV38_06610 [Stellaceae bacterium]|nr:hypothetical protein [Stellaceae bacterium]
MALIVPSVTNLAADHGVVEAIGTAFLVAAILGFTIDRWMKAEIASDVFRSTLGYILPPEFQGEIAKIVSFKFIGDEHEMWYDIEQITSDTISCRVRCERTLRNITNVSQKQNASIHIDDWGFDNKSAIHRCEIHDSDGRLLENMIGVEARSDSTLYAETREVSVEPGSTIRVVTDFVEIRRVNDQIVTVFLAPSKNPRVHLNCKNFQFVLDFGVLEQKTGMSAVSTTHTLHGIYFPPAPIRLRWWPV